MIKNYTKKTKKKKGREEKGKKKLFLNCEVQSLDYKNSWFESMTFIVTERKKEKRLKKKGNNLIVR